MHLTKLASLHRLDDDTSLLVNALSGAVDLVGNDLRAKLLEIGAGERPSLEQDHYESLVARGYLFGSEEEERTALGELHQAYQRVARARPLQLVVFPTYACNLACTYCFEDARARARPEVMAGQQVSDLFAAIGQLLAMQPGRTGQLVKLFELQKWFQDLVTDVFSPLPPGDRTPDQCQRVRRRHSAGRTETDLSPRSCWWTDDRIHRCGQQRVERH